ncbi:MAG: lipoprotein-releasing ABC transporter permease subunit [Deltaproteobacteria bacterium]|nr:lipoprotein-releasing ABC transporter permease subunit [Deltaproteobacteria bacterium]MBI3387295.1 lipoprotein-releasing ABC transporter permease subunit [Deltaproteobacteria bacterium]
MRYELFIGLRYLRAKRKEAFVSLITIMSIFGVLIGVMTLNIALAIMTGLEEDLRDRILGFNPHVVVLSYSDNIPSYQSVVDRIQTIPDIVAVEPFVYGQVMLSTQQNMSGVVVRGVLPARGGAVDLERYLSQGHLEDLATLHTVQRDPGIGGTVQLPGLIVGKELARQLSLVIGDPVSVVSPMGTPSAAGLVPRVRRFAVVGVFDSGMSEYDASLVYMSIVDAQRFFDLTDAATGIEIRVRDLYQASRVAAAVSKELGFPYRVRDWMEVNHNLFSALTLEKTVYFIVLMLIILVAAFNIVATLIMVVMEKRKDIAILKSMGATATSVARVFVYKGLIIGVVGTLLGNLGGYLGCVALQRYEFIKLPADVFYVSTVPAKMYPEYFAAVTLASLLICLLATIYPARQAARLVPVDVIRYE